jgi:putative restriction endonuclease
MAKKQGAWLKSMRTDYSAYVFYTNFEGSNKASSYIRALDLLDGILRQNPLFGCNEFWSIDSVEAIDRLYEYALANQVREGSVFLQDSLPPSYGSNRYYSAALKSYKEFLILRQHEDVLWKLYKESDVSPEELGRILYQQDIESVAELVKLQDFDISSKEGKEIVRQTKTRVNQEFFRKMLLADYNQQCCVTGLNIPDVLRASHIVGWAEDKENRLNPANGLCLSATYDATFDRHLISFDEDYRMIFSPSLKEYFTNQAFQTQFRSHEGQAIMLPKRYATDQQLLARHREKLVA